MLIYVVLWLHFFSLFIKIVKIYPSSVTGIVKNTMDEDIGGSWVSVIFYKEGAMIGGKFTFTEGISSGGEMPFDISIYQMPEGYDDYKVYAYNWF